MNNQSTVEEIASFIKEAFNLNPDHVNHFIKEMRDLLAQHSNPASYMWHKQRSELVDFWVAITTWPIKMEDELIGFLMTTAFEDTTKNREIVVNFDQILGK